MLGMMQAENGRGQSDWSTGPIATWNKRSRARLTSFLSGDSAGLERRETAIFPPERKRGMKVFEEQMFEGFGI